MKNLKKEADYNLNNVIAAIIVAILVLTSALSVRAQNFENTDSVATYARGQNAIGLIVNSLRICNNIQTQNYPEDGMWVAKIPSQIGDNQIQLNTSYQDVSLEMMTVKGKTIFTLIHLLNKTTIMKFEIHYTGSGGQRKHYAKIL